MAYVVADPEMMTAAASDLARIGSNVNAAHMVASARTTSVIPAAADEVSAGITHLFSAHAQEYQALAGQASAFHEEFVQHLTESAGAYTSIEAAIASFLRDLNANVSSFTSVIVDAWKPVVNTIKDTPPIDLLKEAVGDIVGLITAPIWLPFVAFILLNFFYLLSIGEWS